MFWSSVKYQIKMTFRVKEVIVWLILFPIVLGTLYKFTFGSLYEQDSFEAVPTAVVEHTKDNLFHLVMDAMAEADKPILTLTYCSEEEAYELLENGDVRGIIVIDPVSDTGEDGVFDTSGTDIAAFLREYLSSDGVMEGLDEESNAFLKDFLESSDKSYLEKLVEGVSGSTLIPETRLSLKIKSNGMGATMLKKMAEMYQTMQKAGRDIMENAMSGKTGSGGEVSKAMQGNTTVVTQTELTRGNKDPYATYMYNLIAMVAIFGAMSGVTIASSLQANLSPVGARRECAGTPKFKILLADLLGYYVSHSFCMIIAVSFVTFVLGTDFGSRLLYVYLGAILGGIMGVSMGFFIGSIGKWGDGAKTGLVMAFNMTCCFLSGLMVPGIRALLMQYAPVINEVNPAAIVCDSFYFLSVDEGLNRYFTKLFAMLILTAVFVLLGFVLTRRRKYASL